MRAILTLLLLMVLVAPSQAQLFGNQTIDSVDIENALDLLGVHAFRFPVKPATPEAPAALNYVIHEYNGGTLTTAVDFAKEIEGKLPPGVPVSRVLPPMPAEGTNVRAYFYARTPTELLFRIGTPGQLQTMTLAIDTARHGMTNMRKMPSAPEVISERTPLVVRYSAPRGERLLSCPANASVEQIVGLYSYVLVLSVEPLKATSDIAGE